MKTLIDIAVIKVTNARNNLSHAQWALAQARKDLRTEVRKATNE